MWISKHPMVLGVGNPQVSMPIEYNIKGKIQAVLRSSWILVGWEEASLAYHEGCRHPVKPRISWRYELHHPTVCCVSNPQVPRLIEGNTRGSVQAVLRSRWRE